MYKNNKIDSIYLMEVTKAPNKSLPTKVGACPPVKGNQEKNDSSACLNPNNKP